MATSDLELLAKLRAAIEREPDVVPEGHLTALQWQSVFGTGTTATKQLLAAGVKSGLMAMKQYRIRTARGVYPTPHYFQLPDKSADKSG